MDCISRGGRKVAGFYLDQPVGVGFKFQPWKIFEGAAHQAAQAAQQAAQQFAQQAAQQATSAVTQAAQNAASDVASDVTQAAEDAIQNTGVGCCGGGISLGDRKVAGFTLDVSNRPERIRTSACGEAFPPVQSSGGEVGCGSPARELGGVLVPAWVAGAGAGAGVALLADRLGAPTWGTAVGGVGTAIATWAALR